MISQGRKTQIEQTVCEVNKFSEKYQLSHAIFAIEKMYKEKVYAECQARFSSLRDEARIADSDDDVIAELNERAEQIKKDSLRRIRIIIEYSNSFCMNSSRIMRSQEDVFTIYLPKRMENIRTASGEIDNELLFTCRKLVAHELGHIVLHEGLFGQAQEDMEEEADCFAECLLALRKIQHGEILLQ